MKPQNTIHAVLSILLILISIPAFAAPVQSPPESASALLHILLSPDTSDDAWKATETKFQALPANDALHALFPEIAKGLPRGATYAAYNCFEPTTDRKVRGWGEFCVAHWLWCKELACPMRRDEVSKALLELWSNPISSYGQMALLEGLRGNSNAESRIAALFRDSRVEPGLRTEAGVCLLYQDGRKYHGEVVALADQSRAALRERLFDELASPPHQRVSGIDPAVVRMGFALLLDAADKQEKAQLREPIPSDFGQFLYANRLDAYLGTTFVPDRKLAIYAGDGGIERWYYDSATNARDWWSKHKQDYMK